MIAVYLDVMMQLHQRQWDGNVILYVGKGKRVTKLFFSKISLKDSWKSNNEYNVSSVCGDRVLHVEDCV
jgi:hypothetical protein